MTKTCGDCLSYLAYGNDKLKDIGECCLKEKGTVSNKTCEKWHNHPYRPTPRFIYAIESNGLLRRIE